MAEDIWDGRDIVVGGGQCGASTASEAKINLGIDKDKPEIVIVCAACKVEDITFAGARHFDKIMLSQINALNDESRFAARAEQGFIDQYGTFHNRQEAFKIAEEAGQINVRRPKSGNPDEPTLYSEDLY